MRALDRFGRDLDGTTELARHEAALDAHPGDFVRKPFAHVPRRIRLLAAERIEAGDEDDAVRARARGLRRFRRRLRLRRVRERELARNRSALPCPSPRARLWRCVARFRLGPARGALAAAEHLA